jgi:hypothetical protein
MLRVSLQQLHSMELVLITLDSYGLCCSGSARGKLLFAISLYQQSLLHSSKMGSMRACTATVCNAAVSKSTLV